MMKFKLMFLAMLLSLALCAPALAEVKTFGDFKVDVPSGWLTQDLPAEAGKGVILMAPDKSASVTIMLVPNEGISAKDFADAQAQIMKGKVEEGDGAYLITGKMNDVDVSMYVSDTGEGRLAVVSIVGKQDHPAVEGIMNSIE